MEYILVDFPKVQKYMELDGFDDNSMVCVDIDGAYFINKEWYAKNTPNTPFAPSFSVITQCVIDCAMLAAKYGSEHGFSDTREYNIELQKHITKILREKMNS